MSTRLHHAVRPTDPLGTTEAAGAPPGTAGAPGTTRAPGGRAGAARRPTALRLAGAAAVDLAVLIAPPVALHLILGWSVLAWIAALEVLATVIIVLACTGRTLGVAAIGARVVTAEIMAAPGLGRAAAHIALTPLTPIGGDTGFVDAVTRCRTLTSGGSRRRTDRPFREPGPDGARQRGAAGPVRSRTRRSRRSGRSAPMAPPAPAPVVRQGILEPAAPGSPAPGPDAGAKGLRTSEPAAPPSALSAPAATGASRYSAHAFAPGPAGPAPPGREIPGAQRGPTSSPAPPPPLAEPAPPASPTHTGSAAPMPHASAPAGAGRRARVEETDAAPARRRRRATSHRAADSPASSSPSTSPPEAPPPPARRQ